MLWLVSLHFLSNIKYLVIQHKFKGDNKFLFFSVLLLFLPILIRNPLQHENSGSSDDIIAFSFVLFADIQIDHRRSHAHCQLQQHSPTLSVPQGDCRAFERLRNQQLKQHRVEISNMMNSNCSKLSLDCSEQAVINNLVYWNIASTFRSTNSSSSTEFKLFKVITRNCSSPLSHISQCNGDPALLFHYQVF